jgi:hypothetical protein
VKQITRSLNLNLKFSLQQKSSNGRESWEQWIENCRRIYVRNQNGRLARAAHVHARHGSAWHTHATTDNVGGERSGRN